MTAPACWRCGGLLRPDVDGDLRCVACGRPAVPYRPPVAFDFGPAGKCRGCRGNIYRGRNNRRMRCRTCLDAVIARRARERRRRNPRRCPDCGGPIRPPSHAHRCPDCAGKRNRENQNRSAREIGEWAYERKPRTCRDCGVVLPRLPWALRCGPCGVTWAHKRQYLNQKALRLRQPPRRCPDCGGPIERPSRAHRCPDCAAEHRRQRQRQRRRSGRGGVSRGVDTPKRPVLN